MMLRIYTSTSVAQAENYYIKSASKEAYYSEGQEFTGYWGGKAAEMFGLTDRVGELEFTRLCNNLHPLTGEKLTPRMKSDRRPGYDFNFNCPKSVSLAYAYTRDERIVQALRQAVHDTMEQMERQVATRVRTHGRNEDRLTGKWAYGEFIHLTARPENGIPDPHLHIHCYVFNATFDDVEQRWKAIEIGDIRDVADSFDQLVTRRLSENLRALGLPILSNEKSFEIEGIERQLIEQFSHRTQRIQEEAQRRGMTDPAEIAKLAALTRENKSKTLLIPELEAIWWANLSPEHSQQLEAVKATLAYSKAAEMSRQMVIPISEFGIVEPLASSKILGTQQATKKRISLNRATAPVKKEPEVVKPTEFDRRAVAMAAEHLFERHSVVPEVQLIGEACKNWCSGKTTVAGIQQAAAEMSLIRVTHNGRLFLTTAEVRAEEDRLMDWCITGKFRASALNPTWEIQDKRLNEQQRAAVAHVLNSEDKITGISGKAGTGKTTLLHEAKRGIEAAGKSLLVLAPTSEAARDVLRKEGFETADTVAQLLVNESLQRQARGAVWWVDEAGLLSTRTADKLLALAEKLEARVVLVGDTGQHHAVERGQAFDLLQKHGRLHTVEVQEIQRQRGAYKEFVEQVATGQIDRAFEHLQQSGSAFEMTLAERKEALAKDYLWAMEQHKSALVVAPTHAECADVTEGIRAALKDKGVLQNGENRTVLRNLSWTDAQKSDPEHYKPGLIVQINSHVKGHPLGEQYEVIEVGNDYVKGRDRDGFVEKIFLSSPQAFELYQRETIEIAEGERIRITANGRSADGHRFYNGNLHTVDYIAPDGKIVLDNGWRIKNDFQHYEHGYAMTSHGAQGKTVDWVFVAQSAQLSQCASDAKQFYVSVSRGSEGMKLYTDSLELLRETVSHKRERLMATELLSDKAAENTQNITIEKASAHLGERPEYVPTQTVEHEKVSQELGTHYVPAYEPEPEPQELVRDEEITPEEEWELEIKI